MKVIKKAGSFELVYGGDCYYWQSVVSGPIGRTFQSISEAERWFRDFANSF